METKQVVFMVMTLFIGLFQFFTARLIIKKDAKTKRDITQNLFVKQWGRNSLLYSGFIIPFYYFGKDKMLAVVLIYIGLLMYNVYLLKKGIRRANHFYPVSDPNGEQALVKKEREDSK